MKIRNNLAFTLAEILIVIIVIGFLTIFTISSLSKAMPDKNRAMFKKTYSVIEKTVQELVNDETLYPYNPNKIGFLNDIPVPMPNGDGSTDTNGIKKFSTLFIDKLNLIGKAEEISGAMSFTTTDGVYWEVPIKNFTKGTETKDGIMITVDVNGKDKAPNRLAAQQAGSKVDTNADKFNVYVYFDGKVSVEGNTEKDILKTHALK